MQHCKLLCSPGQHVPLLRVVCFCSTLAYTCARASNLLHGLICPLGMMYAVSIHHVLFVPYVLRVA